MGTNRIASGFLSDEGLVLVSAHEVVDLCRIGHLDLDHPAVAVAVLVDRLGSVAERLVDLNDVTGKRREELGHGLDRLDFAEALAGDTWCVVDATLLAPRTSLVRIASGRDAADTAFLTVIGGTADLHEIEVGAIVEGELPNDDPRELVSLG